MNRNSTQVWQDSLLCRTAGRGEIIRAGAILSAAPSSAPLWPRTSPSIAEHRQRSRQPMPEQYIVVERDEPIATATINRPDKLNALNWALVAELADRLEELDADDAIRCIVLTGAGERAFAAGADIAEMAGATPIQMAAGAFTAWDRIRRIKKP